MSRKLIVKKFELENETKAEELVKVLNKGKYNAINLGSGVVSQCRQTKKLEKMLSTFEVSEFIPSDFDVKKLKETFN